MHASSVGFRSPLPAESCQSLGDCLDSELTVFGFAPNARSVADDDRLRISAVGALLPSSCLVVFLF